MRVRILSLSAVLAMAGCDLLEVVDAVDKGSFGSCYVEYASVCEEYATSEEILTIEAMDCLNVLGSWSDGPCPRAEPVPSGCCTYESATVDGAMCFYDLDREAADRTECAQEIGGSWVDY
jgi:hypothetical protein